MTTQEKLDAILQYADEMKADQIEVLDVHEKTTITEFFVICTGTSDTHVRSIAERISERLRENHGERALRQEEGDASWVLIDFGDVVLNVMREEKRQFYSLEELWNEMPKDPTLVTEPVDAES